MPAGITQIDYDLFDPNELASKDLDTVVGASLGPRMFTSPALGLAPLP